MIIAGHDPSGGAGLLADVKTAASHGVYDYAICTGYTFQNSKTISHVHWFSAGAIIRQIELCYQDRCFDWVKLGIVRDTGMLKHILVGLKNLQPRARVVWDPVLSASDGTPFIKGMGAAEFEDILPLVYLATPNLPEINSLYPGKSPETVCSRLSEKAIIYLKGGHDETYPGRDRLFIDGEAHKLSPGDTATYAKHGSGCVLSSALTANLALRYGGMPVKEPVLEAAVESKRYTEQFLGSDPGLLGWHETIRK